MWALCVSFAKIEVSLITILTMDYFLVTPLFLEYGFLSLINLELSCELLSFLWPECGGRLVW